MTASTGQSHDPRSIVAIDVGATNVDVVQFDQNLEVIQKRSTPAVRNPAPPYLSVDVERVIDFALHSIEAFDGDVPVDAVVPCTHGSSVALLDESGELVLPVMSYLSSVPDDVAKAYGEVEPSFSEVYAPTNPDALTVARQLFWQERAFAEDFSRVRTIMPYAQYIAFRLSGEEASEVTSLGAQTHLWAPEANRFSSLAATRGWDGLAAPLRRPSDALGPLRGIALNGRGMVLCGIHDSSASFLQIAHLEPVVLLSTGTWIIGFDTETELSSLDPHRDQVANVRPDGRPIASARFMGGEEFALLAGDHADTQPTSGAVEKLIKDGTMALPSFTDSGGPMPETGGRGAVIGPAPATAVSQVSLATLYTAQMTAYLLKGLGTTKRVVVDGVFAENDIFMGVLANLLDDREIFAIQGSAGSSRGAASLALNSAHPRIGLKAIAPAVLRGLGAYWTQWVEETKKSRDKWVAE